MLSCHGKDDLLFFTDQGRVYRKKAHELKLKSGLKSRGSLVSNLIQALKTDGGNVVHMMRIKKEDYENENLFLVFVTERGMVKRSSMSHFKTVLSNGKVAVRLMQKDGITDKLKFVLKTTPECDLCLVSSEVKNGSKLQNKVMRCPVDVFRPQSRVAMGRRGIQLDLANKQTVLSASTTYEGNLLVNIDSEGYGKFTDISKFRKCKRGNTKGVIGFASDDPKRKCLSSLLFNVDDDILMTTNEDKIYKCEVSELGKKSKDGSNIVGSGPTARGKKLLNKDLESHKVTVDYYSKLPADAITVDDTDEILDDDSDDDDTTQE